MQFKVPQFLDIEDKIFGPFTFRQFAYLAGGGGLCFVIYRALPWYFAIFLILPLAGLSLMLTFYKINNKPFLNVIESAFKYAFASKLYIWKRRMKKKEDQEKEAQVAEDKKIEMRGATPLGTSRLKDLSWSLDVLDVKKGNEDELKNTQ
ncbi:MAG: PrgI family protein [Candidatus Nomurabacteria bacterium]|nr:PrgI family protein [Candidatus Nomurabacteria bacterium]